MLIYTTDEVLEDIFAYEGCKILSLGANCTHFTKLYSEVYDAPMENHKTVNDLKNRINEYTDTFGIPDVDILPCDNFEFVTYYFNNTLYVKYGEYQDKEESTVIFKDNNLASNDILVYIKSEKCFIAFQRELQ